MTRQIGIEEGVIGRCIQERKPVFLRDIPENYFFIASGLGEIPPKYLILIPLLFNHFTNFSIININ